ncbi:MAG: NADP-dependent oxidoreductase, partial [Verrucomicrobiae bacterium]|nr:NADP-dependent oxidoreductase [Verrucomicrobiae bacterium]
MKAIAINNFGGRDQLKWMELPDPVAGKGEVRVRVKAAGVNPVDWKIREGLLRFRLPHQFPIILGWDMAGVVEDSGEEVYAYCRKPIVKDGAYAEWIVLPRDYLAPKPKNLSFIEAASIPLAALTAYQSLFDAAKLKKGQTVLI